MMVLAWILLTSEPKMQVPAIEFVRAGITCKESISPSSVPLIGNVRLTLTAEGGAPLAVDRVEFIDPPGWHIREADPATTFPRPGGREQWQGSWRLSPDKPGDLSLLPPTLHVRAGGRETSVKIEWQPITVHVTTTLPRVDLDEARGVTGPEPAPPRPTAIWLDQRSWAAAIVIVALITAVFAGRNLRPRATPEPPPHEWASAELERLSRLDPASQTSADMLADVLRDYLARQYGLAVSGKTNAEVLALLHARATQLVDDWAPLLERCDLTRFADARFSEGEWANVIERVRRLTKATLPVGKAAVPAASRATGENA